MKRYFITGFIFCLSVALMVLFTAFMKSNSIDLFNCSLLSSELQEKVNALNFKNELATRKLETLTADRSKLIKDLRAANEEIDKLKQEKAPAPLQNANTVPKITKCWRNTPSYRSGYNFAECRHAFPRNFLKWKEQPDICSFIALSGACKYRHIFGLDYDESSQTGFADFMMLDFVFTAHKRLKHIVELGSYKGVSGLYLGAMANVRGGQFVSIDHQDRRSHSIKAAWARQPYMQQVMANLLLKPPYDPTLLPFLNWNNTFYFFDNGNKIYEVNNYLPFIAENNSPFCTHDWENEIRWSDIEQQVNAFDYIPFGLSHAEMLGTHVRCFHKRGTLDS